MGRNYLNVLKWGSIFFILAFVLILINQIIQLYLVISGFSSYAGLLFLVLAISGLALLLLTPVFIFFKLPKPLSPPVNSQQEVEYHRKLLVRLKQNKLLNKYGRVPGNTDEIPQALEFLKAKALEKVKYTAKSVFVTTAISQNGKLDALTVLVTQGRMLYQVANIFYQRPSIQELVKMYSNVGTASLMAYGLEELDISQQMEPVVRSLFRSSAGKSIPLVGPAANIIMDSLMEGTVNAFFTLRVGIITIQYCGATHEFDKKSARRSAYHQAGFLLKEIVVDMSRTVIKSILEAIRKTGLSTMQTGLQAIGKAGAQAKSGIGKVWEHSKFYKRNV